MSDRHQGIVLISMRELADRLGIPPGGVIEASQISFDTGMLELRVSHPNMPMVFPGCHLMRFALIDAPWNRPQEPA